MLENIRELQLVSEIILK